MSGSPTIPDGGSARDRERVAELLGAMRTQTFYMMRRAFPRPELLGDNLLAHLEWLIALEKRGLVLLSGPLRDAAGGTAGGVTVFRCEGMAAAMELAGADPLVVAGAATCEVFEWQVNEGRLTVSVDLSDGEMRIG